MSIGIWRLVISLFFLQLSHRYFTIFPSPILILLIFQLCVPLMLLSFNEARHSSDWGGLKQRQWLLLLPPLHPPPPLHLLWVEWHLRPSWHNLCTTMLALTLSMMSCVRWTPVLVVSHDDKLSWVVWLWLRLLLPRHLRMMTMTLTTMMLMSTMVLAPLVMMKCLLDILTISHSWQKGGVVLRWE